jgi:hypothetical protein
MVLAILILTACQATATPGGSVSPAGSAAGTDLSGIRQYLLDRTQALKQATSALKQETDRYYALAAAAGFDYPKLWQEQQPAVVATINTARTAWKAASPLYEQMEAVVAGTPALAGYDVILDAGASGEEDPANAAPIDLHLPDGRTLTRPGNLFGVTESTLWGAFPAYAAQGVTADWDGNGAITFGETLPDANVLKAGADALDEQAGALAQAAADWQPTLPDAFNALVVMTPTMSEYFASWRDSRFVSGDASTQRDFVAISRLADMQDILGGLELIYAEVQPLAATANADQADQVATGLTDLRAFVAGVYAKEQDGKHFTPEEADLLGEEAQNRATAVTGHISQLVAQLGITLPE